MCPFVYVIQNLYDIVSILYWFGMFGPIYTVPNTVGLIFFTYLIEVDGLSVAKSSYCDELSDAKRSNMVSVAKDDVRRNIHTMTASLATVGVRRYNL